MNILVTGSAGYIGASFSYKCLEEGHTVIGIDNYSNSDEKNTLKLKNKYKNFHFFNFDLEKDDCKKISDALQIFDIEYVVHFAALKAVGESEEKPYLYWKNNVGSSFNIIEIMKCCRIRKLIFSSSATVYGSAKAQPVSEESNLMPISTYGSTKISSEYFFMIFPKKMK